MADLRSLFVGFDGDSGTPGAERILGVQLRISGAGGSIEAKGQQTKANSIPVTLASDTGTLVVDTEFGAAAALTDDFANPTVVGVGAFNMVWDGATWDRMPGTSALGVTVNTEFGAAAALTDDYANPTVPNVGAFGMVWDGATWDRMPGTSALGVLVNTEFGAAAALTDAYANPTVPNVGSFMMGFNGTTWDRIRTANTGRLQVDVITGGGTTTPANPLNKYVTSAALAAGASANLDTGDIGAKRLTSVEVWSTVAYKAELRKLLNTVADTDPTMIAGGQPFDSIMWKPPHPDYVKTTASAGTDGFRVTVTNLDDGAAADVYATFHYED